MQRFLRPLFREPRFLGPGFLMRHCPMLGILLVCAACTPDYPLDREGTWRIPKVSSNEANLKVMVANPRDLIVGQTASGSVGSEAAPPVARLVTGTRTALPNLSSTTQLNVNVVPQSTAPAGNEAAQNE